MQRSLIPRITAAVLIVFAGISRGGAAELELASPFSEHMVLQRQMPLPVWGWGQPGQPVTVEFHGQKATGAVGKDGKWKVSLPAVNEAGGPFAFTVKSGGKTIAFRDVLVGEVWICSGQSNMSFPHRRMIGGEKLAAASAKAPIRYMEIKQTVRFTPQDKCEGKWARQLPSSAVALAFAAYLNKDTHVPVGIILTSWGSSSIEGWMPLEMQQQLPHFRAIMEKFNSEDRARVSQLLAQEGKGRKWGVDDNIFLRTRPNILYNAMLHPVIPYAVRGMVWYQGEANATEMQSSKQYGTTLPLWCQELRKRWNNDAFCFMAVMLPRFGKILPGSPVKNPQDPAAYTWAYFREQQMKLLALPHTAVACTMDLGELNNIHPLDKEPIGKRLALLAAGLTGEAKGIIQGPLFTEMQLDGNSVRLSFQNAEGLHTTDGKPPREFWVSSSNEKWVEATARIEGTSVILTAPDIPSPKDVRYAFSGFPDPNLVNQAGLPALPFRTDRQ